MPRSLTPGQTSDTKKLMDLQISADPICELVRARAPSRIQLLAFTSSLLFPLLFSFIRWTHFVMDASGKPWLVTVEIYSATYIFGPGSFRYCFKGFHWPQTLRTYFATPVFTLLFSSLPLGFTASQSFAPSFTSSFYILNSSNPISNSTRSASNQCRKCWLRALEWS